MSIRVHLLGLIFQELHVDCLVGLDLLFVIIFLIFVVLLAEHLHHGLVVNIGDEFRLELLLDAFDHRLVLE